MRNLADVAIAKPAAIGILSCSFECMASGELIIGLLDLRFGDSFRAAGQVPVVLLWRAVGPGMVAKW